MGIFQTVLLYIYSFFLAVLPISNYTEGVTAQPQSFLTSQATNETDKTISHLIYRGLFKYDQFGTLVPDLAETWTISDDGLVYTIKLKPNQSWTNGVNINSDDLIYTSFKVADLAGVATDKVDNLTVRYTLPNKYAPFINLLTVGVMPANSEEKDNKLSPVSSGDFRIARIEKTGAYIRQIVLVNPHRNNNINKMVFRYYSNDDELETAARLGEIDAFVSPNQHEIENFEDRKFPIQGSYYALFFNLRDEKFKDETLRQNFEKVLPINHMIEEFGIGVQGPISRSVFTDNALNFNKYDETFKADLKELPVTITVPDTDAHVRLAQEIKTIWEAKLNVKVTIKKVPSNKMKSEVIDPRNFEILFYGHEVSRDPDRFVIWHSTQKDAPGLNLSGFDQVRADRALEEGRKELDNYKRVVHYNEFQKVVVEQTPAIFLYHPYTHYYVSKYIEGMGEKYTFTYTDRFLDFPNWKHIRTN